MKCDMCGKPRAKNRCFNCGFYYCDNCLPVNRICGCAPSNIFLIFKKKTVKKKTVKKKTKQTKKKGELNDTIYFFNYLMYIAWGVQLYSTLFFG